MLNAPTASTPGDNVEPGFASRLPNTVPLPRNVCPLARFNVASLRWLTSSVEFTVTGQFVT